MLPDSAPHAVDSFLCQRGILALIIPVYVDTGVALTIWATETLSRQCLAGQGNDDGDAPTRVLNVSFMDTPARNIYAPWCHIA